MDELDSKVPTSEAEADALIASIEAPATKSVEMPAAGGEPEAQAPAAKPTAEQVYNLSRKGVTKDFPLSKILQFAQQGWDYNERVSQHNQQLAEFEKQRSEHAQALERLKTYQHLEDYIKQDPQWWEHIRNAYQQRTATPNGQLDANGLQSIINEHVSKAIAPLQDFVKSQEEAAQDTKLNAEINTYREAHPDFDWKTTDDQGRSILEQQILHHAVANGIGNFRAAANDFLHDQFLKRAQVKSREQVGQELKKQTKLGLGPVTNRPTTQIKEAKNVRGLTYDQIAEQAMKELGIA